MESEVLFMKTRPDNYLKYSKFKWSENGDPAEI